MGGRCSVSKSRRRIGSYFRRVYGPKRDEEHRETATEAARGERRAERGLRGYLYLLDVARGGRGWGERSGPTDTVSGRSTKLGKCECLARPGRPSLRSPNSLAQSGGRASRAEGSWSCPPALCMSSHLHLRDTSPYTGLLRCTIRQPIHSRQTILISLLASLCIQIPCLLHILYTSVYRRE